MNITIRDVAKKAEVSASTVSRVLSNANTSIPISEETRKKVLDVCEELKFQPNIHARRFFTNKSETIGLIIPPKTKLKGTEHTFADHNIAEMLSGSEATITANGYRLTILVADDDFIDKKKYLHLINDKSLDGLLFWGLTVDESYILDIQKESFPYILLNSYVKGHRVNSVIADNERASFDLAEHMIGQKHRLAYIKGMQNCSVDIDRYKGFKAAMRKHDVKIHNELIETGDFSEESGYQAMKSLLSLKSCFTAVIAANDMMAIGAMKAIKEKGLKIPGDIAVAGGDGIPLAEYMEPPLTTFKVPTYEIGVTGVNKLFEIIQHGQKEPVLEVLRTELIVRESSG